MAQHKHHRDVYEEADSNKRRKRYARPLIDLHMKIFTVTKGWSHGVRPRKLLVMYQKELLLSAIPINNLFSCLWFNEVDLFRPRDQLSFGYVVYR